MAIEDEFTGRLSDYLDDEVDPSERARIDAHLRGCASCRTIVRELQEVRSRAVALADSGPSQDLWPGIAERIGDGSSAPHATPFRPRQARRFSFTLPQLVAASLALMVVSGGGVWLARRGGPATDFPPVAGKVLEPRAADLTPVNFGESRYDEAIGDLEQTITENRDKLDPETVRIIEENLAAIDRAIDQCRRALAADPANTYLKTHLVEAKKRKLALLRRATALVNVS
jgi:putative zinc finger protein